MIELGNHQLSNVNPGLINPKRLFNWEGTIEVSNNDYWRSTTINKPWTLSLHRQPEGSAKAEAELAQTKGAATKDQQKTMDAPDHSHGTKGLGGAKESQHGDVPSRWAAVGQGCLGKEKGVVTNSWPEWVGNWKPWENDGKWRVEIIGEPSTTHKNDEFRGSQAGKTPFANTCVLFVSRVSGWLCQWGCPKMEHPQFNAPLVFTVTGVIHPLLPTIQVMTHINMFVKFTMCFCGWWVYLLVI